MKLNLFVFLFTVMLPISAMATGTDDVTTGDDFISYEEIINQSRDNTECSTGVFANALAQTANNVSETDSELTIKQWITATFSDKAVLTRVLECPEIASLADDDTIRFMPIMYTFPGGREIVVNYETQPKIFKQRILLADKQSLPASDPNPRIGADDTVWTNVDPAWYAIMITEHGALNNFVGPEKNNTISLQYIYDNIDSLYPSRNGGNCTDRSALSRSSTAVNQVMSKKTVNVPEDDSEYYIAGDVSLRWISYLEIGLDLALTVMTAGGFQAITGITKAERASRALKTMATTVKSLEKSEDVIKYTKVTKNLNSAQMKLAKNQDELAKLPDRIKDLEQKYKNLSTKRRTPEINAEMNRISQDLKHLKSNNYKRGLEESITATKKNITDWNKEIKTLSETKDVKTYAQTVDSINDMEKYLSQLKALKGLRKTKQTGNVLARTAKNTYQTAKALHTAIKTANSGTKALNKAAKLGRAGMRSGRTRDWLFHSTMRNAGKLATVGRNAGLLYGAIKFIGGMYDWTETSTGDFTNNIEFTPLLLLSADDIKGQGNEVNHGMWLMWAGDSTSPTDDDAAFLQAMDFASKFHEDLMEYQNDGNHPCNIDIWVVRPVIREPGTANQELYYLIMNDRPWTTAN